MAKNEESLLGKIKLMTGEQMDILNNDFFSQEIESLKRRIEQVECSKTHEEIAKASLSEMEERKLKVIDTTEENHNPSKDFEAIACRYPHLAKDPSLSRTC